MGVPRTVAAALASRVLAWIVAAITLAVVVPRRNPLLAERGWATISFPEATLPTHLLAIGDRWDAHWYTLIATEGYDIAMRSAAFFPLYPLLVAGLHAFGLPAWLAGVLVSTAAMVGAVLLLDRVVCTLGGSADAALWSVLAWVTFPAAVVLGSVYPESLLVALTCGAWLAALRGQRGWCALWCGLAMLTKPLGVAALAFLLLQRPVGEEAGAPAPWRTRSGIVGLLGAVTMAAAWPAFLWLRYDDPWRFLAAQSQWNRDGGAGGPVHGVVAGVQAGLEGLRNMLFEPLDLSRASVANLGDPVGVGMQDLVNLGAMALLLVAGALAWRRLGAAPGLATMACALVPLSAPSADVPLLSAPRFLLVAVPAFVVAGTWLERSPRRAWWLAVNAAGFGLVTAAWTTWQWVG